MSKNVDICHFIIYNFTRLDTKDGGRKMSRFAQKTKTYEAVNMKYTEDGFIKESIQADNYINIIEIKRCRGRRIYTRF